MRQQGSDCETIWSGSIHSFIHFFSRVSRVYKRGSRVYKRVSRVQTRSILRVYIRGKFRVYRRGSARCGGVHILVTSTSLFFYLCMLLYRHPSCLIAPRVAPNASHLAAVGCHRAVKGAPSRSSCSSREIRALEQRVRCGR